MACSYSCFGNSYCFHISFAQTMMLQSEYKLHLNSLLWYHYETISRVCKVANKSMPGLWCSVFETCYCHHSNLYNKNSCYTCFFCPLQIFRDQVNNLIMNLTLLLAWYFFHYSWEFISFVPNPHYTAIITLLYSFSIAVIMLFVLQATIAVVEDCMGTRQRVSKLGRTHSY